MAAVSHDHSSPGIRITPGVCGGVPCVGETRIPVWILEQDRRLGASVAEVVRDYPMLNAADVKYAWAYARLTLPRWIGKSAKTRLSKRGRG